MRRVKNVNDIDVSNRTRRSTRDVCEEAATTSSNIPRGASRRKLSKPKRKTKVLKEIAMLRKTTSSCIPKLPFARIVREITMEFTTDITRYTFTALEALQEATEMYMVQMFEDAYYLSLHRKCVTLTKFDLLLLRYLNRNI